MHNTHTKGPWAVFLPPSGHYSIRKAGADYRGSQIARAEGEANARLIAAAPELLEAAQKASFVMADAADADFMGDDYHEAIAALRAAIQKATGGQP